MTDEKINRAIHEALGRHVCKVFDKGKCVKCHQYTWPDGYIIPDYVNSLDALRPVFEKLVVDGWDFSFGRGVKYAGQPQQWYAIFRKYPFNEPEIEHGEEDASPSKAIALAVLKTLEVEI